MRTALLVAFLAALVAGGARQARAAEEPLLASSFTYLSSERCRMLTVADVNEDGRPDLIMLTEGASVSVMLGRRNMPPAPATTFSIGVQAIAMTSGDVNGDGHVDLVTWNISGRTVSVLLGRGDGTFAPRTDWVTAEQPLDVKIADVTGDHRADLVVACKHPGDVLEPGSVSVLPGNGDGTFGASIDHVRGGEALAVADLNGDGKLDLVTGFRWVFDPQVFVHIGNGDGTFVVRSGPLPPGEPGAIALADLNADGVMDLVVTDHIRNLVSVARGIGDGTFAPAVRYFTGGYPNAIAIADFNGDGRLDLATSNLFGDSVTLLLGKGDGTFAPGHDWVTGGGPYTLEALDVDGDGVTDIVTGGPFGVSMLHGNGDGAFGSAKVYGAAGDITFVAAADVNGDGVLDLASTSPPSVRLGLGDGTFGPGAANPPGGVTLAIGDVNGDSRPDLVVTRPQTAAPDGAVGVMLGAGDGTFGPPTDWPTARTPTGVAIGDIDGDGHPDLVTANSNLSSVSVLLGEGDGTFSRRGDFFVGGYPVSIAIADLNADGRLDLVVANFDAVAVLLGNGDGTFGALKQYETSSTPWSVAVGDLNRDGIPDVAAACVYSNTLTALLGKGDGSLGRRRDYGPGINTGYFEMSSVAIADLDLDGKPDLVATDWVRNAVVVLRGHGNGTFGARETFGAGSHPGALAIGDFDGDGRLDVAVANEGPNGPPPAPGSLTVLLNGARRGRVALPQAETPPVGPGRGALVADASDRALAREFKLIPIAPSPTRERVRIAFEMAAEAQARVSVVDVMGRRVALLADGIQPAGRHETSWDPSARGGGARPGLYFVRFEWPGGAAVRKVVLAP